MVGEDDGKDNDTTMGAAYDASLAREVVNECTTSANVRRVVAHAIEGVTRALGGAHADMMAARAGNPSREPCASR